MNDGPGGTMPAARTSDRPVQHEGATPSGWWRPAVYLAVLGVVTACGSAGETSVQVERTDSAGVGIVRSTGADRALDWRFDRVSDLGGADSGPEAFARIHPTALAIDDAGRLYVLDVVENHVSVFDRDGTALLTFGRAGGGPGEFGFPSDLAVTPEGTIAVYDFARRGLLFFSPDGSVLPVRPLPGVLQRKFRLSNEGVAGVFAQTDPSTGSMVHDLLIIAEADTTILASRPQAERQFIDLGCVQLTMPPIWSNELPWDARRGVLAFTSGAEYSVVVRQPDGGIEHWRRDLPLIDATESLAAVDAGGDSMRATVGSSRCAISTTEAVAQIGFAPHTPRIQDLVVTPDGGLWVRRRNPEPGDTRIDVFAPDGAYIGTLPGETPWPADFRGPGEFVTVEPDSLDLQHIVSYRVTKGSS